MKTWVFCLIFFLLGIICTLFFYFLFPERHVYVCGYDQRNEECQRVVSDALKGCPGSYSIGSAGVEGVFIRPKYINKFINALSDQNLIVKVSNLDIYFTEFRPKVIPDAVQTVPAQPGVDSSKRKNTEDAP